MEFCSKNPDLYTVLLQLYPTRKRFGSLAETNMLSSRIGVISWDVKTVPIKIFLIVANGATFGMLYSLLQSIVVIISILMRCHLSFVLS